VQRERVARALAVAAAGLGIVTIVTRPFLFAPIAVLILLLTTKLTADRRLTGAAAAIVTAGAFAGATIAIWFTKPLY
jgi:hypothetical protein